jgi:hypothetical protein
MKVELDQSMQTYLEEWAKREGISPEQLVERLLERVLGQAMHAWDLVHR